MWSLRNLPHVIATQYNLSVHRYYRNASHDENGLGKLDCREFQQYPGEMEALCMQQLQL